MRNLVIGRFRPNAVPAKQYTVGDKVRDLVNSLLSKKTFKRNRYVIGDICDFCFKNIWVKRALLSLRIRGWKMSCLKCYDERYGTRSCKETKIIIEEDISYPTKIRGEEVSNL